MPNKDKAEKMADLMIGEYYDIEEFESENGSRAEFVLQALDWLENADCEGLSVELLFSMYLMEA